MQAKSVGSDDVQGGKAFRRSMGLLAAVTVAAAAGLAVVDVQEGGATPNFLRTDANDHRPAGAPTPLAETPLVAPAGNPDPTLSRPDRGSDQHG
jgi:hypothetical protein